MNTQVQQPDEELAVDFVFGHLENTERTKFVQHLGQSQTLRDSVDSLSRAAAALVYAVPQRPAPPKEGHQP